MAKYEEWDGLFAGLSGSEFELSFEELEGVAGESLPAVARSYPSWWRAGENARWSAYGWKAYPNLRGRTVRFTRAKQVPPSSEADQNLDTVSQVQTSAVRLILVGGVSGKKDTPHAAADVYESALWEKRRAYVEATGCPWMILSSEYGLLHPDTVIEPYNAHLRKESISYRRAWSERVAAEIIELCEIHQIEIVEAHAGADYLLNGLVGHLNAAGLTVSWPLRGRRIGEQLSWYTLALGAFQSLPRSESIQPATGITANELGASGSDNQESVAADGPLGHSVAEEDAMQETRSPKAIVVVASALNKLRLGTRAVGSATSHWSSLLSAELTRRESRKKSEQSNTLSLRQRVKLAESIAYFAAKRTQIIEGLSGSLTTEDTQADELLRSNPFAVIVGIIMDQGAVDDGIWSAPWLLHERLGHLDPQRVVDVPARVLESMEGPPALHRSATKIATWIVASARTVLDEYEGDASSIWATGSTREEVRGRLERLDGIGPRQSARAVEFLETSEGLRFAKRSRSPMAFEADLRRVMLRTGLAEFDDIEHMTKSMSALYPEDPGSLDHALLAIGNLWCHAVDPRCDSCAVGPECPRLIEPGGGVPQTSETSVSSKSRSFAARLGETGSD